MNGLDYLVLLGSLLGIAAYGTWRTRGARSMAAYFKGTRRTGWLTIGLSVMATQASAVTFMSTPGQCYESGLGFVQNYFGLPLALILVAAVFLPRYRRLNVYTAYEYLGQRFDTKTRLLGAALFLLQRGLAAGITIYAPAIVLSTVFGWRLDITILLTGLVVITYTVAGGSEAVTVTHQYQMAVIFAGMLTALGVVWWRLPHGLSLGDTLSLAGGLHKLEAVDFSLDLQQRYTFWSGLLGGLFLSLSYFGTDQSQVQRYLHGASLRESRLGLMFNAIVKIPMQFFILFLGVLVFVFYQFERPPVYFNEAAWRYEAAHGAGPQLRTIQAEFATAHAHKARVLEAWLAARHAGNGPAAEGARQAVVAAQARCDSLRSEAKRVLHRADPRVSANDADYVFITFVFDHLPHGLVGLLVAVIFAAALSSKASELNALGSATTVDFYRHVFRPQATEAHYVAMSRLFTALWGVVALGAALFAHLVENLIQAVNILGSIFYGVVLGLFLLAFFLRRVQGTAAFWGTLAAQGLVFVLYFTLDISYLWYNFIGCAACVLFSLLFEAAAQGVKP